MRWRHEDLDGATLTIRPTRVSAGGQAIDQDDAKSTTSGRTLPLPKALIDELRAAKKRQAEERLAAGGVYSDEGYVACNEIGEPLHPDTLTNGGR